MRKSEYKMCAWLIYLFEISPQIFVFWIYCLQEKMHKFVSSCLKFGNISSHNMWQWTVSSSGDSSASAFKKGMIVIPSYLNCNYNQCLTKQYSPVGSTPALYSGDTSFQSGVWSWLSWHILRDNPHSIHVSQIMPFPDSPISFPVNYLLTDLWFLLNKLRHSCIT
jgi:hypothetical protein